MTCPRCPSLEHRRSLLPGVVGGALLFALAVLGCDVDSSTPDVLGPVANAAGTGAGGAPTGGGAGGAVSPASSAGSDSSLLGGESPVGPSPGGSPSGGDGGVAGATVEGEPDASSISLEPGVRFVGRVDTTDPEGARFAWSGAGVVARFSGTSLGVRLDGAQQYTVLIDGQLQPKLTSTGGSDALATGLVPGVHEVELYRRTEANQGESRFRGFDLGEGELLAPPPVPDRRIEIFGDSISCGYGNEGANMSCSFTPDTENHYLTYGAIAARNVGAELSTVAWSGKGVVCNYGDDATSCIDPMPIYFDRALPERQDSVWDFSRFQPQAVVVNLGTNDFSTAVDPSEAEFVSAYVTVLDRIRNAYPDALILCTVGPLLGGADLTTARAYIASAVQQRNDAGDASVQTFELATTNASDGYGCDYHPSLRTHEIMAEVLTSVLENQLGW